MNVRNRESQDDTQAIERDPKLGSGGWRKDRKFLMTLIVAPLAVMALGGFVAMVFRHDSMLVRLNTLVELLVRHQGMDPEKAK